MLGTPLEVEKDGREIGDREPERDRERKRERGRQSDKDRDRAL